MEPQYWSIDLLPGLSTSEQNLLKQHQITNTKNLLQLTSSREAKMTLASKLQLNQKYIDKWSALADLARLPGVGCQYCGLLLHAGIVSVSQLSQTPFPRLHRQLVRLQVATLHRKDLAPPVESVKKWVEEAKKLNQFVR